MIEILEGDCLERLSDIPDNSIDLICTDPPYFKVKKDWWDNQWDEPSLFVEWLDCIGEQWQRVLKPNGSLYCFASSKMATRVEITLSQRFKVLNRINWIKTKSRHNSACRRTLKTFFSQTEVIIFCEQLDLNKILQQAEQNLRGSIFEPLINYLVGERKRGGFTASQIIEATRCFTVERHSFQRSQFELPTKERYLMLQTAFPGYFLRPHAELQKEYKKLDEHYKLQRESKNLYRKFSVDKETSFTDAWVFPPVAAYPGKHPCEKPSNIIENIIKISSKPGDTILDCFAGSGVTLAAAKKLKRNAIGIEIDPHWCAIASHRCGDFSKEIPPQMTSNIEKK
ncbi:MAG: site-specific DNA-methyltransferase [Cyanobacteria bacterium P01_E01_bin.42]